MKTLILIFAVFITISVVAQNKPVRQPKVKTAFDFYLDSIMVNNDSILKQIKNPSIKIIESLNLINSFRAQINAPLVKYSPELAYTAYLQCLYLNYMKLEHLTHTDSSFYLHSPSSRNKYTKKVIDENITYVIECLATEFTEYKKLKKMS